MPVQTSLEDLGTPLADVTFCILDLETTGGSAADDAITEIGAVKVRCGEVAGTFHTLVDPGRPVPAFIRLLTGISDEALAGAPPIRAVLPSLLEFIGASVVVAHNARFDVSFLNAALLAHDRPPLENRIVDTAALARKTLAGEVRNHQLATLAAHLRCAHRPSHRAYADALATTDVLHVLIERVAGYGVTTLEDLCAMTSTRMDGTFAKLALAEGVPSAVGVYRFLGPTGATLYVGKATDLRARVRSYFYGDPRRKIRDLLRETQRIETETHGSSLEAEVAEARAILRERPPYNRAGKKTPSWYLKVALNPKDARVSCTRVPKDRRAIYAGPFDFKGARALVDALQAATDVHRCARPASCRGCAFSELRSCAGHDKPRHNEVVRRIAVAFELDHDALLAPLAARMHRLARQERFEEAAEMRDRGAALERALRTRAEIAALRAAGRVVIASSERAWLLTGGRLVGAVAIDDDAGAARARLLRDAPEDDAGPLDAAQVAEARVVASWLRRNASEVRVVHADRAWALPVGARPHLRFRSRERR